jgi:hypothetical protein
VKNENALHSGFQRIRQRALQRVAEEKNFARTARTRASTENFFPLTGPVYAILRAGGCR